MASSTQLCLWYYQLLSKEAVGAVQVSEFERAFNQMQIDHLQSLIPPAADMAAQDSIAMFQVEHIAQMTSGVGLYNPNGDLCAGPLCWITGQRNRECSDHSRRDYPSRVPLVMLPAAEFISRSRDITDRPTRQNPVGWLKDGTRMEVLPPDLPYINELYWRFPRPIKVGTNPAFVFPDVRPLEGAPDQIDPEWQDDDCNRIVGMCLEAAGIQLQSDRLVQLGRMLQSQPQQRRAG